MCKFAFSTVWAEIEQFFRNGIVKNEVAMEESIDMK